MPSDPPPILPGSEVLWFLIFMAIFYGLQVPIRRVWQLSLEGVWLIGFAALAVTFYFRVAINLLLLTGLCLGLLVVLAGLWGFALRGRLRVTRDLPPEVAAQVPFTITYTLKNLSPFWLFGLRMHDHALRGILPIASADRPLPRRQAVPAPARITFDELDAGHFTRDPFENHPNQRAVPRFPQLRLFLRGREELTLEQPTVVSARGLYRLGPLEVGVRDPMGLHTFNTLVASWDLLRVLPHWVVLPTLPREMFTRYRQDEETSDNREGLSSEFRSIREYRPGDPLRAVHWALTARHRDLVVRQYQQLVGEAWGLLLDCREAPELGLGQGSDQERAISLVASLTGTLALEQRPFVLVVATQRPLTIQFPADGLDHQAILRVLAAVRFDRRDALDVTLQQARDTHPEVPWLIVTTRAAADVREALLHTTDVQPRPVLAFVDHSELGRTLTESERFGWRAAGAELPTSESSSRFLAEVESFGTAAYRLAPGGELPTLFEVDETQFELDLADTVEAER